MHNSGIVSWTFNPFLRILPAFVTGILVSLTVRCSFWIPFSFLVVVCIGLMMLRKFSPLLLSTYRKIIGLFIFSIIVCAALLVSWLHEDSNQKHRVGNSGEAENVFRLRLIEEPVQTQSGFRAVAEVLSMVSEVAEYRRTGKVYLYFPKAEKLPAYGDELIINKDPRELNGAMNPGAFNFKEYAARKGIRYAFYLRENEFIKTGEDPNNFITFLNDSRRKILQALNHFFKEREVRGIAAALLIGYRGDLEKPLLQEYSDAGVVHVIAISGLHLGLIYVVLVRVFMRMKFLNKYIPLRCWCILALLWLFSLLTGGSASVLRSAVMFSFILIGETYFKKAGTWNVIAASAFVLLVYDPMLLFDAGFLLSYSAVAGIVAWQKSLYHLVFVKNRFLREVWNMASVTIAAQIAAFPLCIYYFHQFPNLFLLTNLIVVPLSTIILFGEVFLLMLSFVPFVNDALAFVINSLIKCMNEFVKWSNSIPFSSMRGIYADLLSTSLLYATVICFAWWIISRKHSFALPAFGFLSALFIYFSLFNIKAHNRRMIVFYHSSKGSVIDFVHGRKVHGLSLVESNVLAHPEDFTLPARTVFRANEDSAFLSRHLIQHENGMMSFLGKTILLLSGKPYEVTGNSIEVDYLLLTGNKKIDLVKVAQSIRPSLVIFDASNSAGKIAQWKRDCEELHLRCFSIRDNGALISTLHPD